MPMVCWTMTKAMAATALLVFAGGAFATWLGRERRGVLFHEI
jgi:hypothetical protein